MSTKSPPGNKRQGTLLIAAIALIAILFAQLSFSFSQGPNNRNVSVDAKVNVTGSAPEILSVSLDSSITLNAGSSTIVQCNATIRDYNGFADIDQVNGTFFSISQSSYGQADNNNTHYTNTSCIATGQDGAFANYTCSFGIKYYAVNDTWNCSVSVNDTIDLGDTNSNVTTIEALLALNVTSLINYGDMAVGDISSDEEANVSNLGNRPVNVSVLGYAQTIGDGLSFVCEQGSLTADLERFAANATASYAEKQALSGALQQVHGLTVGKPTNDSGRSNSTYWQLRLDPSQNVFGECNGSIIFQAGVAG